MGTLTLKSKPIVTVPLEDWYEELGDESLDPLNQLIAEEEATEDQPTITTEETTMSTQVSKSTAFDINNWMNTLAVLTDLEVPVKTADVAKPDWLEIKGPVSPNNAFAVTAGVVKAARKLFDGIAVAKQRHDEAVEKLTVQEYRSLNHKDKSDAQGLNPDGYEHDEVLKHLKEEVTSHETIINKGTAMMEELLTWIHDHSVELNLEVETGHTVTKDLIGNEFRRPKMERLDANTLMFGIKAQKDFIRKSRQL